MALTTTTDPLAQSLVFDDDETISAVGIWFAAKATDGKPVTVEIHDMAGGFPGTHVFVSRTLLPSEITLNVETKVAFERYLRVKGGVGCCIVILTDSNEYKVQTGTLGRLGQNPTQTITTNPYPAGVLFQSSNARTWSPLQGSDLRMKVYGRQFSAAAILQFESIGPVDYSDLFLGGNVQVPQGTTLTLEYELNGDNVIRPFNLFQKRRLDTQATSVLVRFRLATDRDGISPIISLPTIGIVGMLNALAGKYVSRNFEFSQDLESGKVYATAAIPSGCTVTWFISNDDGVTWDECSVDATESLDANWNRYTLSTDFTSPVGKNFRLRADLTASSALVIPTLGPVGATLQDA